MIKALDFYPDRPGSNPTIGGNFFSAMLSSLMGARPGLDFNTPKMASRHHK